MFVKDQAQLATAYFLSLKLAAFLAALVVSFLAWSLESPDLLALVALALRSFGVYFLDFHSLLAASLLFSFMMVRSLATFFLTIYKVKKQNQEVSITI